MAYIHKFFVNSYDYLFFLILFLIGIYFYKDFGFNIDESFQRKSGLYWLKYVSDFFQANDFSILVEKKLETADDFTIPWFGDYGIIFDLPAAFFEVYLNINDPLKIYEFRHLLNYTYFIIGVFFFYKLIKKRFSGNFLPVLASLMLVLTPRVFGDSFHNNKDIIFLTFFIISIYYYFESIDKNSLKNILFLSLFSAIATSTRIFGIILPLGISFIFVLSLISNKSEFKNTKFIFLYLFFFLLFLILHWPFLWENTFNNLYDFLTHYKSSFGPSIVFFNGNFYKPDLVPNYYLALWILITTPIQNLILFFLGLSVLFSKTLKKLDEINSKRDRNDFWHNNSEKKDFFILFIFLILIFVGSFFEIKYYNSWRFFYFLNFFIVYFSVLFLEFYLNETKFKKSINYSISIFLFLMITLNIFKIFQYHPYQSLYFNLLASKEMKKKFEVDFMGLSSISFLRNLALENENSDKEIKVGVKSWYPMWRTYSLLDKNTKKKIKLIPNDKIYEAEILYSNRIYDVNIFKSKKYDFDNKFRKTREFKIDEMIIYEVFERKK